MLAGSPSELRVNKQSPRPIESVTDQNPSVAKALGMLY